VSRMRAPFKKLSCEKVVLREWEKGAKNRRQSTKGMVGRKRAGNIVGRPTLFPIKKKKKGNDLLK